jgi:hypothetical protein
MVTIAPTTFVEKYSQEAKDPWISLSPVIFITLQDGVTAALAAGIGISPKELNHGKQERVICVFLISVLGLRDRYFCERGVVQVNLLCEEKNDE